MPSSSATARMRRIQSDTRGMREYDLIADWFPTDRGRIVGVAEALAVAAMLPAHSRILDVGCGNGVPVTRGARERGPSCSWTRQFRRNA